jgi:hypothetical protein
MFEERITRRDALKKAAYMTPVILTFLAAPSFASGGSGSGRDERHEEYEGHEEYEREGKGGGGGGNGKRGGRWLWDHERDQRRHKKQFGWWE